MSKDLFKNLIEAVVALAADEVVKLLDRNRGPHADLARVLYVDMGAAEHIVKRQPFEAQLRLLDGKREPVADSAQWLWLNSGQHQPFYTGKAPDQIVQARIDRQREVLGCGMGSVRIESWGVLMNGLLYEPAGDGWSFKLKYPDRERTADSAQYLWKNQHSGDWVSLLQRYTSEDIRSTACGRQKSLCTEVADAAWKCFDSGYWQAHHFIYNNVSAKRIIESAEAIKDFSTKAKSREVRKNATIELTPAEVGSGLDRVKWAEGLIKQLPEDHEGRNSWLMNYGQKAVPAAETVELKIYSLSNGDSGSEIVIRFYDAKSNEIFKRVRSGRVKYSSQLPFIDRFDVPGGYSYYTASVAGECYYTVERVAK